MPIPKYPNSTDNPETISNPTQLFQEPLAPESFKHKPFLRHAVGLFVLGLISFLLGLVVIILEILILVQDWNNFPHGAGIGSGVAAIVMASIIIAFLRIQTNLLSLAVLVISSNTVLVSLLGCYLNSKIAHTDIQNGITSINRLAKIISLAVLCALLVFDCLVCFIYMCKVNHEFRSSLILPDSVPGTDLFNHPGDISE